MKNITVTVHDETYRQARVWAAKENTTVSALVRHFLESLDEHSFSRPDLLWDGLDDEQDNSEKGVPPSPPFPVEL
ncbi:MAG: hypothetical protein WAK26_08880 [Terracidiphilus sp.]